MAIEIESLAIPDVKLVRSTKIGDARGFFSEVYNEEEMCEAGIDIRFVQDNHSWSEAPGVLRGLHFQTPPSPQAKLVRVVRGSIFDVVVDLRKGSPTYAKWVSAEISVDNWTQILVPRGFAHGFLTLEPNTEVLYKVDRYFDPTADSGLRWDDPDIGIDWPTVATPQLSDKDKNLRNLADWESPFEYED
jgi:dTDP-4-dehydrorhamnose 3,5-epimerase